MFGVSKSQGRDQFGMVCGCNFEKVHLLNLVGVYTISKVIVLAMMHIKDAIKELVAVL